MPFVPGEIVDEERAFARFDGGCILCVTAEAELADGHAVAANKDVVVVCPFWSGTPYEMLIIPTRHEAHLYDSPEADLAAVGRAIRDALTMLADRLGDVAYNLVFHTAPPTRRRLPSARAPVAQARHGRRLRTGHGCDDQHRATRGAAQELRSVARSRFA